MKKHHSYEKNTIQIQLSILGSLSVMIMFCFVYLTRGYLPAIPSYELFGVTIPSISRWWCVLMPPILLLPIFVLYKKGLMDLGKVVNGIELGLMGGILCGVLYGLSFDQSLGLFLGMIFGLVLGLLIAVTSALKSKIEYLWFSFSMALVLILALCFGPILILGFGLVFGPIFGLIFRTCECQNQPYS